MVETENTTSTTAYIGLGSNEGNREQALRRAIGHLGAHSEIMVSDVSPVYETDPVEVEGDAFLNAVTAVRTTLTARQLLEFLNRIEKSMGRVRLRDRKTSRVIDLDLLLFGETVLKTGKLTLPHPRMRNRRFVLNPLADLNPQLKIPGETRSVTILAESLARKHPEQGIRLFGTLDQQVTESL